MVHSLPCVGYTNHGYFTYTPRCMFDLAGYNQYEVVHFAFEGPGATNDLYAPLRDYASYFSVLGEVAKAEELSGRARQIQNLNIMDVSLFVVYRKIDEKPFAGALEVTTSVGEIPQEVSQSYKA